MTRKRTPEQLERRRELARIKRAENQAKGLRADGKPRQDAPQTIVPSKPKSSAYPIPKRRKPAPKPPDYGASLRGTPLAMDLEASVRRRVAKM